MKHKGGYHPTRKLDQGSSSDVLQGGKAGFRKIRDLFCFHIKYSNGLIRSTLVRAIPIVQKRGVSFVRA